ncbi:hypothetical protein ABDK00_014275 [Niabella insulamsoli]|uniref:hypothetical protein n=1 Tax=Niabella insulamsoli TaxID=3144874 RepID=UPI0031FD9491
MTPNEEKITIAKIRALETFVFAYIKGQAGEDIALANVDNYDNFCRQLYQQFGAIVPEAEQKKMMDNIKKNVKAIQTDIR